MKIPRHSSPSRRAGEIAAIPASMVGDPSGIAESLPALVAVAFGRLDLKRRSRLLGRLLGCVGPLALAVIGGGAFVRHLPHARWPVVPVSLEDAARATFYQVHDLVRYVEQSNPDLIEGLLNALLQDGMAMTALGASIAAAAIKHVAKRESPAAALPRRDRRR